ncbi:hypothetical protein X989_4712 [Burkholderia pseudomallei MSHR4378]|nr:hypothetical protein X989_4712 [Burkholderia pseudomallei MSHR4378]KGS25139.1 hypothetical protein X941_4831 [Burkholderia pseudomallei MSHR5569]
MNRWSALTHINFRSRPPREMLWIKLVWYWNVTLQKPSAMDYLHTSRLPGFGAMLLGRGCRQSPSTTH